MAEAVVFEPRFDSHALIGDAQSTTQSFPLKLELLSARNDLAAIFHLRYRAYRHDGHIPADAREQFRDRNDDVPSTVHVGAFADNVCVGAVRISFAGAGAEGGCLPCAPYYPEVAMLLAEPKRRLVEFSRLAVDPAITNVSYKTTIYAALVRAAMMAAEATSTTDILVATKPTRVKFYEVLLGFARLGRPAKYPPGDLDITLLRLPMERARKTQKLQNRFFSIADGELASMRRSLARVLTGRDALGAASAHSPLAGAGSAPLTPRS